nr:zinc finger protein 362 [Zonotrichia albicollis]
MDADKGKQRQYSQRMAEPRFNNPYFWPPPPTMPSQLDNLVLINKIKEQLMAEKIRPPHLPPTSVASQQPLLVPPSPAESSQSIMSLPKLQQTFFTKSEMQIHSKSHTEAKPHKCPHCSKSFANASYLAQHLRIHLGVKPYHCSYCEKSFRQLSHLQQHTR